MKNVLAEIEDWAKRQPERLLYSFLDCSGREVASYTYERFLARVDVIASRLLDWRDFQAEDRLLLAYPPGLELICAFFACARAGLIPVPVSPPTSHGFQAALHRMDHIARDSQAVAILTNAECRDVLHANLGKSKGINSAIEAPCTRSLDWIATDEFVESAGSVFFESPSNILFLQYTSGSTSKPKGAMVTHDNVLTNFKLVVDHPCPIAVSWLPQYHDMGLLGYYIYSALSGATTYGFSPTSFIQRPALWLETITRYRATASSAPNFAYEYCLRPGRIPKATFEKLDLSSLRFLAAAAEPINPDVYRNFLQMFQKHGLNPASFFVAYGLAENTLAVSNYGRTILSVHRHALTRGQARITHKVSDVAAATHIMSCGTPLGDNRVAIVDPERRQMLEERKVGEVWIAGASKCLGYWNNPEATRPVFRARLAEATKKAFPVDYLRSGDMGFLHEGELYLCGRIKDMFIIRGQNYYPHDIERIVEKASNSIRKGCVAVFDGGDDHETSIVIVAELTNSRAAPEPLAIANAVRANLDVEIGYIVFVPPKSVPKTSSGKIMRFMVKQMWLEEKFEVLSQFSCRKAKDEGADIEAESGPLGFFKARYKLTGKELYSLIDAGVDSLDLVLFHHQLKDLLAQNGAGELAEQIDMQSVQHLTVAELFRLASRFERAPETAIAHIHHELIRIREEQCSVEQDTMARDKTLAFEPARPSNRVAEELPKAVLMTGGTGFLGPFLLTSLLEQTEATIYVVVRAKTPLQASERLRAATEAIARRTPEFWHLFERRVIALCGDLEAPNLGLDANRWNTLANEVDTIYHNGATVNYLLTYGRMRGANVIGTNEILRLAFQHRLKTFNYISTTFIFGWATKDVLYETDNNEEMELLDFGYSQSKWVAEQVVGDAMRRGLTTRIFRPALITPSVAGSGNLDIGLRLLAFMINHGIGVDTLNQVSFTPADITANNIVAISNLPETVNSVFHVTRDDYANMTNITDIITQVTQRRFDSFELPMFVPEVIHKCTKDDPLFPLLGFLVGSVDNISSMEFKRYDNSNYRRARDSAPLGVPDPSLEQTVLGILRFLQRTNLVNLRIEPNARAPLARVGQ